MSLERHAGIGLRHALAIVNNLNKGLAGILYIDFYVGSAGVYGVLHQFFDYRRRPLYHLSGGNLICHGVGEKTNNITHWA